MVISKKGDCEHCRKSYRYSLIDSEFGENSYAYCDRCGSLATLSYSNHEVAGLPTLSARFREMDAEWEHFLRPCPCGGHFKKGASPRCPYCRAELSAEYATNHLERNSPDGKGRWRWQRNWNGQYAISVEDPNDPGTLKQLSDPVKSPEEEQVRPRGRWSQLFSFDR
jgi:hypothetical protein